ncbi:hypothetical protein J3R74_003795 [Puniceicoccus vermicola]
MQIRKLPTLLVFAHSRGHNGQYKDMPQQDPQNLSAATEVAVPCWGAVAEVLDFPTSIVHPSSEEEVKSQRSRSLSVSGPTPMRSV